MDAFTQGYVEAALRDFHAETGSTPITEMGFSDLAPETHAAILKDCGERCEFHRRWFYPMTAEAGAMFWANRQRGTQGRRFPPLTAYLGDDGKVYLRDAQP